MSETDCALNADCLMCCGKQAKFVWPTGTEKNLSECYDQQKTILFEKWNEQTKAECKENKRAVQILSAQKLDLAKLRRDLREVLSTVTDVTVVKVFKTVSNKNGIVFQVCNPEISSQSIVVKVDRHGHRDSFEREFHAVKRFFELGLGTKPIGKLNTASTVFAMGKVDLIFGDFLRMYGGLEKQVLDTILAFVFTLLHKFKIHNVTHGDFHWDNIGLVRHKGILIPVVIDLGFASTESCYEKVDWFQLARSTTAKVCGKDNAAYLSSVIKNMYKEKMKENFNLDNRKVILEEYLNQFR